LEVIVFGNSGRIYAPEELLLFRRIFENAFGSLPAAMRTSENRARIARAILDCAATGERDPVELRIAARIELQVSAA
jgi:DNA-binding FadR family transcriptional regulator